MEFHATRLLVRNFRESLAFYRDVLEFKGWHNDEMEYAYFEEKQLALFARERMPAAISTASTTSSPQFVLQFEIEDVDEVYRKLLGKGIHFVTPPTDMVDWGSRVAHFCDPDGNLIELYKSIRD
ncbi:glyoxalase superfamily protein [Alicyclobacillus fastidiosus]|uniref:Glyoxalase superfamily protein n=1 Tax=Alicyclobacillus fastidiosus TaxID=392011 RepID=A0ABV5ABL7_9BACL|nr:glyoxalase superfamily protein [Alicyclobacillus fastidiosus]WEH10928.1 glyoxalase superfamily protein [Alicyclobacillus fastidiosus]